VLVNDAAELLLCHVTGQEHWDLPKGGRAEDETPLQAALRETREETGLLLPAQGLLDLGRLPYRRGKDLHLFAARLLRFDPAVLWCESRFDDEGSGTRLPEMDGYGWFAFTELPMLCTRKLSAVLHDHLCLTALLAQLQRSSPVLPQFLPAPPDLPARSAWQLAPNKAA
jgi:8-oxo-dGTP pyrophosphatase MutT (NUDIX family)